MRSESTWQFFRAASLAAIAIGSAAVTAFAQPGPGAPPRSSLPPGGMPITGPPPGAHPGPAPSSSPPRQAPPAPCTRIVAPGVKLAAEVKSLPAGGVLCLEPGLYPANLIIDQPMTLRGLGSPLEIILDGGALDSVIEVSGHEVQVTIEMLGLANGASPTGGGAIRVLGSPQVALRDLLIKMNHADRASGGALYFGGGTTLMERCRLIDNHSPVGAAMAVEGTARVGIRETLIVDNKGKGSAIQVSDGAEVHTGHLTLAGAGTSVALSVQGNPKRVPTVTLEDTIISGRVTVENGPRQPGKVVARHSLLDGRIEGLVDGGQNRYGDPMFAGRGADPYRPLPGSPAIGLSGRGRTAGALRASP